jgi:hypothetical protein
MKQRTKEYEEGRIAGKIEMIKCIEAVLELAKIGIRCEITESKHKTNLQ